MTSIMQSSTSSSSSTSSKNLLRISGMASGIDTDSVVKSMVANYQAKIDKENQAKQILQWQQDGYRDIIKGIKDLQDYFNPTSSKNILGGSAMNINTATSDTPAVASATASSTAQAGTYAVTVNQLAEQAKIQGSAKDSLIKISDFKADTTQQISGTSGTVDLSGLNSNGATLVADINNKISASTSSLKGQVSASYVQETVNGVTTEYIKFTNTSSDTSLNYTDSAHTGASSVSINSGISSSTKLSTLGISGAINLTVNNTVISLNADTNTTIQNLMDQVKSATSGAVIMNVDDTTGKISFQSKSYGSTSSVSISGTTLTSLGLTNPSTATGKDANVTITAPGQAAVTTTQSSNQFTINGVSYNLLQGNNSTANITVTANTDNVVKNVQNFITDYNTIISTINTKLTEKKDSAYPPLTDAQKESMSESQITAWEAKAKVGVLRNDDYLNNLMTQLRGIFSSPVYSSYSSADATTGKVPLALGQYGSNAIGIDTSSDYTDGGKLVIVDQNKLSDTIANRFDDFKKLFTGASSTAADSSKSYIGSQTYMEDGLFTRMNTILRDYVAAPGIGRDGKYTLSGSMNIFVNKQYDYSISGTASKNTLPDQVYSKTLSISKIKTQMSDAETRYYAQFTALETAMTKLNAQQSQLSSMLGTA